MLNACLRSRQGECGNVLVTVYQQCVITLTCFSHYYINFECAQSVNGCSDHNILLLLSLYNKTRFMRRLFRIAGFLLLAAVLAGGTATLASCSEKTVVAQQPTLQRVQQRGVLLVGTTGDYRPLTYRETDGSYWGFGIELADSIACRLCVGVQFVPTSWPSRNCSTLPWAASPSPTHAARQCS